MISNARFVLGTLTVDIGNHQWDFSDGSEFLERTLGVTPYGVLYREKYGIEVRNRAVRFAKTDALIDSLRRLGIEAARTATRVQFIPDVGDLATFWWVDWPDTMVFTRVIDNREEIILPITEQSAGA